MTSYSLYLHIPFCSHRCAYCDFNTYAGMEQRIPAYIDALCTEIRMVATGAGERLPVHSVFFGGGTPSLLTDEQVGATLRSLRESFEINKDAEITLEANPGSVSLEWLAAVRRSGVNRISMGMQSADESELSLLTRRHTPGETAQAVRWARTAGFDNLSLDLIFGLPGQTVEPWERTLETALSFAPEHLSLYALTVEEGTPLAGWVENGRVPRPDDDLAAAMYELASERLEVSGYRQYEISNWSLPGRECIHNLQYWLNRPYLGFGAGAHGYARGVRTANLNGIEAYIHAVASSGPADFPRGPALSTATLIDRDTEMGETMMVGLRLTDHGVLPREFQARFGLRLEEHFARPIARLQSEGLLEWSPAGALRLTRRGRLFGNRVFREFI